MPKWNLYVGSIVLGSPKEIFFLSNQICQHFISQLLLLTSTFCPSSLDFFSPVREATVVGSLQGITDW
jgi:hypothetical protein